MSSWSVVDLLPGVSLYLAASDDALCHAAFTRPAHWAQASCDPTHPVLRQAADELHEYAAGARRQFTIPFELEGTHFQCGVWAELCKIPYGETRSYADLARALGHPSAVRAVGAANAANPLPVIIPCHRVIGASGRLTGFAGGLAVKRALLVHEGVLLA